MHESAAPATPQQQEPFLPPFDLGAFVRRSLILFNLVFGLQAVMDLAFLWGHARLPQGMTYAQYAHRGAYPLILTALLAAAFVLLTFRPGGVAESSKLTRRLVFLWLGQNLFLTLSSLRRLDLYIGVYSLTRLRLAAGLWMVLILFGLGAILWRILRRRDNAWLLRANQLAVFGLIYACSIWDFSGFIATFNVDHSREMGGPGPALDAAYIEELGPSALPALCAVLPRLPGGATRDKVLEGIREHRADLRRRTADWRGWTWQRQQLLSVSDSTGPVEKNPAPRQ
jgi:hypothetical protein